MKLRVMALVALAVGVVTSVLGFLPGREYQHLGSVVTTPAGGSGHLLYLALSIVPAIAVLRKPTARRLGAWTAIGWVAAVPFYALECNCGDGALISVSWPAHIVDFGTTMITLIAVVGAPVAAWLAAAAARPEPPDLDTVLAHRLRRIVQLACMLGLAVAVVGFLPGERIYDHVVRTRAAGGVPLAAFVGVLLAPGALVYVDPQLRFAWMWSLWALPATVVAGLATIDTSMYDHVDMLWPRRFVEGALGTLLALLLLVLPIVWMFTREHAGLPEARLKDSSRHARDRSDNR